MIVSIICAVLCILPCRFWALCTTFRHARESVRTQLETECQKEVNNKLNIRTKSIIDSDSKALINRRKIGLRSEFLE